MHIMNLLKKLLPDVVVIVLFAVISFAYFCPAVTEGRILAQHDAVAGIGAGHEAEQYKADTGKTTRWTNSLFGGMPNYQLAPSYESTRALSFVQTLYSLFLPKYVGYVFIMLLGFYLLLRAFNFKVWMSALGAIIWAFSSYFFIIISAGHIWKVMTLAYVPLTVAGMVLVYRRKLMLGAVLTTLAVALQVASNHVQMTYYFLFVMLFMAIAFGVQAYREKAMLAFWKSTGVLAIAGLLGIMTNMSNLYHTYQYSKESMRGKSELVKDNAQNQTGSGLERDYITQWSYGIGETFSLMVPNVKGGASVPLGRNETGMKKANPMYRSVYNQIGQYWGEQPGTSGPVYVGAFVMFLFLLGCFIVKGPMKWALLGATVFSIVLSWGKNFMGPTDFFIDYVPMYNKFRAVSSILVIAEFTIPLLAIMALKEVLTAPSIIKENKKALYITAALTAGLCLVFALMPDLFFSSFISNMEMNMLQGSLPKEHVVPLLTNLEEVRIAIFTADAWRSFLIIVAGIALLLLYCKGKLTEKVFAVAIIVLCLGDMWSINKRYLYDAQFVAKGTEMKPYQQPSQTDQIILQDKTLDYRVLNLASNTFNENNTSYWHKSIGGYHAAKLRRYQEMIEEHIAGEMNDIYTKLSEAEGDMQQVDRNAFPVLNMLNTRYFILPAQQGTMPMLNPYAMGNAWFVDRVEYVANANEEIAALHGFKPAEVAYVDRKFESVIKNTAGADSLNTVKLLSYAPNELVYETNSVKGGTVIFSENYYPGWKSLIDGEEVNHGRANYILRAMNVPAGKHEVKFVFEPRSLDVTEAMAYVSLLIVLAGIVILVVRGLKGWKAEA